MMKRIVAITLAMLLSIPLFGNKVQAINSSESRIITEDEYVELFEDAGVEVPASAVFSERILVTENGESYSVATMMTNNGNDIECSSVIYFEEIDGKEKPVDLEDVLDTKGNRAVSLSGSKTYSSVYMTGYYYRLYTNYGDYAYKPYKVSFVNNGTTRDVYVAFQGTGFPFNSSGTQVSSYVDSGKVERGEYPAYTGQQYSRTNNNLYYYYPYGTGGYGFLGFIIQINGGSYWNVSLINF